MLDRQNLTNTFFLFELVALLLILLWPLMKLGKANSIIKIEGLLLPRLEELHLFGFWIFGFLFV